MHIVGAVASLLLPKVVEFGVKICRTSREHRSVLGRGSPHSKNTATQPRETKIRGGLVYLKYPERAPHRGSRWRSLLWCFPGRGHGRFIDRWITTVPIINLVRGGIITRLGRISVFVMVRFGVSTG